MPDIFKKITVEALLREGARTLASSPSAALDARLLLMAATGLSREALILQSTMEASQATWEKFRTLLDRRKKHEPIAYILGEKEFWGQTYRVTPDVLIPRPDSETLIMAALARRDHVDRILDLGTGSGCLLGALLSEYPGSVGVGVDLSPAAAAIARSNLQQLGLGDRSTIACGEWFAPVTGTFDLIVTNPPYIDPDQEQHLPCDVRDFEPTLALYSADEGHEDYQQIFAGALDYLAPNGLLIVEIGDGHAAFLRGLSKAWFPNQSAIINHDLAGKPRAIIIDTAIEADDR